MVGGEERAADPVRERDGETVGQRNPAAGLQLAGILPERLIEVAPLDDADRREVANDRFSVRLASVAVSIVINFAKVDRVRETLRVDVPNGATTISSPGSLRSQAMMAEASRT